MQIENRLWRYLFLGAIVLMVTACANTAVEPEPDSVPSYQQLRRIEIERQQGAIYQAGYALALYEDIKARRIGDVLTVLLVEETSGQNSSDNNINQSTAMNISAPTFGGRSRPRAAVDIASDHAFTGESGSSQSNRLSGSIAVTVHEVLANGNLVVQGEKRIRINQGNEYIRLQGVVRPRDIDPLNTVFSTQVADARISYGGSGTNAQGTSPGLGARILFSPLWPF